MNFWPFPARAGAFCAFLGLLLSEWWSPLVCATAAVAALWLLLVAQR